MNTANMLRVGTILHGVYRIERGLSSGGFGNTYLAIHIEFGDQVAIKEFFIKGVTERDETTGSISVSNITNYDSFKQQKEKFKKEARRLRMFNNPHIVSVHALFEENGTAYYVMDYIDGENLSARLKRTGKPMSEQEVKALLPQLFDALKTVHDEGLWHLDLKPGNIMLDKTGRVRLIDFGASKQLDRQRGGATAKTAIAYTNGYAPREQIEQNYAKFGPWTDIYALGATLYAVLTNSRPPSPSEISEDESPDKHVALPFPDSVSDGMHNLVLYMMKQNRTERPQSVDVLMQTFNSDSSSKQRQQELENPRRQAEPNDNTRTQNSEETQFKSRAANEKTQNSLQSSNENSRHSSQTTSEETAYTSKQTSNSSYRKPYYQRQYYKGAFEKDSTSVALRNFALSVIGAFLVCGLLYNIYCCSDFRRNVYYEPLGWGVYVGGWSGLNGSPQGYGTIYYNSGEQFTGVFSNGLPHGYGVLKSADGTILYEGEYSMGQRIE